MPVVLAGAVGAFAFGGAFAAGVSAMGVATAVIGVYIYVDRIIVKQKPTVFFVIVVSVIV